MEQRESRSPGRAAVRMCMRRLDGGGKLRHRRHKRLVWLLMQLLSVSNEVCMITHFLPINYTNRLMPNFPASTAGLRV